MKTICDICEFYPCTDDRKKPLWIRCPGYSPIPKPQTNADRIKSAKTEEELMECIFHALKMSRQYIDSRRGMVEWLRGTQWSYPIIPADKEEQT